VLPPPPPHPGSRHASPRLLREIERLTKCKMDEGDFMKMAARDLPVDSSPLWISGRDKFLRRLTNAALSVIRTDRGWARAAKASKSWPVSPVRQSHRSHKHIGFDSASRSAEGALASAGGGVEGQSALVRAFARVSS